MPKSKSHGRKDQNQTAFSVVQQATGEVAPVQEEPKKNPSAVALGRLGGLKGGKARSDTLSSTKRSEIAKIAAMARWKKPLVIEENNMALTWSKSLTDSDAQQDTSGAKMPFLRFTKEKSPNDHRTWFRRVFFANAAWTNSTSRQGRPTEITDIDIHVVILGKDLGFRKMRVDHDPSRSDNHGAPTTHLHYDSVTRQELESSNLTGNTVVVTSDAGNYSLVVQ